MSIELNVEMSAQFGSDEPNDKKKCILDVITIDDDDDDEDDYVEDIDDDNETDEIQIIEIIDMKSMATSGSSTPLPPIEAKCGTDESVSQTLAASVGNNCSQTMNTNDLNESNVETNDSEVDNKSPKRVSFLTLDSNSSSTSCATNQMNNSSSDPTPNKVIRISVPEAPEASTSAPKVDFETLYQNYLKAFRDGMSALSSSELQIEESVKKLNQVYAKLKSKDIKFLQSSQFAKLMDVFTKEVLELSAESAVIRHHNDLILELNRLTQPKKSTVKTKNKAKRIKELTSTLKKLQKQIYSAENEVYDFDALNERTSYTDLPKLYRKVQEVWAKREELLKRSTNSGRLLFKKLKYDKSDHPVINRCVESLFNNHMKRLKNKNTKGYIDESFTFIDVRKAILDEINAKQIVIMNIESVIQTVYKDLLSELRSRRSKDSEEVFETLETLDDLRPETFVDSDPAIEIEIAKNKSYFDRKMDELMQRYTTEDRRKNGESVLTNGQSEWDLALEPNEEFESLDVIDGDLEEEDVEEEDKSDDEVVLCESSVNNSISSSSQESVPTAQPSSTVAQEAVPKSESTTTATDAINGDNCTNNV